MRTNSSSKLRRLGQVLLLAGFLLFWYVATSPTLLPPIYFDDPNKAAFFFGEPLKVVQRIWEWFAGGTIYAHLWVTLLETALAFAIGTALGLAMGLWLALAPTASAPPGPDLKAPDPMPRAILAPLFALRLGPAHAPQGAPGVTVGLLLLL